MPERDVQARDGANRDPLVAGEKTPAKPSQTFSRDPATTGRDERMFAWPKAWNGVSAPFSPVKSAIKHNGHYAQWFLCTARLYFGRGLVAVALKKAATKAGLPIIRLLVTQAQSNLGMILIYKIFFIKSIFNELVSCL